MSCIHVDTSGNLPLPPVEWVPTGRVESAVDKHGIVNVWTWFRCGHCGAPGFRRNFTGVTCTWKPEHMRFVA